GAKELWHFYAPAEGKQPGRGRPRLCAGDGTALSGLGKGHQKAGKNSYEGRLLTGGEVQRTPLYQAIWIMEPRAGWDERICDEEQDGKRVGRCAEDHQGTSRSGGNVPGHLRRNTQNEEA